MQTKEIKIQYKGAEHEVTIKKLSDLEKYQFTDSISKTKINPTTGVAELIELSMVTVITEMLKRTIIKAPFEISSNGFNELEDGNLDVLFLEAQKFNELDIKKKEN